MPTPAQLKAIHTGARRVGLNDMAYRTLLRNVGGVESSKDLSNASLEDVMAVLEDMGFTGHPKGDRYWRDKVAVRGTVCGERMTHKIIELSERPENRRYYLGAMCLRMSDGRTPWAQELHPREAWNLIEALKNIGDRTGDRTDGLSGRRKPAATDAPRHDAADAGMDAGPFPSSLFQEATDGHAGLPDAR